MIKIVIYNPSNGKIISRGQCHPESVPDQTRNVAGSEFYLNCPPWATHIIDNEPVALPPDPPTTAALLEDIRVERRHRLTACDWTQTIDSPLATEIKTAWAEYRQLLRDFPETCDPTNPIWPTPPN